MRVLFHFDAPPTLRQRVHRAHPDLEIRWCAEHDDAAFYRELPDADVLWHVLRPLEADDLQRAGGLALVQKLGSGLNTIDLVTARRLGIGVSNMVGANAQSVCEATLALMLATARRVVESDRRTRAGRGWPTDPASAEQVFELGSSVVGLIGYGAIAQRIDKVLTALGAQVIHTSSHDDGTATWVELDELLARARIVSVHCPLTEQTRHLIGPAELARMQPGSILVNTARGAIVDEQALIEALRSGHLAGAGLDVFDAEPTAFDNPLFTLANVVVSPHTAWLSRESFMRAVDIAADNVRRLQRDEQLSGEVIPPARR